MSTSYSYVIIGGTTKAATTSLYYYLADHPSVCISSLKETRFFMDTNYPVPPLGAHWTDGYDQYEHFFRDDSKMVSHRVEASPDYLYSIGTPQRIKDNLPNAKFIFVLRDPVSRMISWFKYARQRADIPQEMEFNEYVQRQLEQPCFEQAKKERQEGSKNVPRAYFFSALEHGRYAKYLQPYFQTLDKKNIKILFYKDVCYKPREVLLDVCEFSGLDSSFYNNYEFKVFNRSDTMKNPFLHGAYDSLRSRIRKRTHNLPIHNVLRQLRQLTDPIYYRLNTTSPAKIKISEDTIRILKSFYEPEIKELEYLIGYSTPWELNAKI